MLISIACRAEDFGRPLCRRWLGIDTSELDVNPDGTYTYRPVEEEAPKCVECGWSPTVGTILHKYNEAEESEGGKYRIDPDKTRKPRTTP